MDFAAKAELMNMKKILWVDDDVNTGALRAFVDEFVDNGIQVEKIDNPDDFLNMLPRSDFDCLILDVLMPVGQKLSREETEGGTATGLALLNRYLKEPVQKPVIICTIRNDEQVRRFAIERNIPYKLKQLLDPDELVEYVLNLIGKND